MTALPILPLIVAFSGAGKRCATTRYRSRSVLTNCPIRVAPSVRILRLVRAFRRRVAWGGILDVDSRVDRRRTETSEEKESGRALRDMS